MSDSDQFDELLAEWERRRQAGEDVSPVDLSGGDEELASRLQDAIARLLRLERFLGPESEPDSDAAPTWQPGRIGEYVIIEELARGGSGTVYRARQESLNRDVALKLLRASDRRQRTLSRFQREARAMTVIRHPRIAQVFDAGAVDLGNGPQPYLVMELLDGSPLDAWLLHGAVDISTRLRLFASICEGVAAAHARGIIHRDLKPSNILVDDRDEPKICDFGIARILDADQETQSRVTASSEIVGTIQYMSPEHVSGPSHQIDTRSDIYSLGLILFELVTGERPYDTSSQTIYAALDVIRHTVPPPVRRLNSTLHRDLETIIGRCLEKSPDQRYQSVESLQQDLQRLQAGEPIAARPVGSFELTLRLLRRHPWTSVAVVFAVVSLIVGSVVSLNFASRAQDAAITAQQAVLDAQQQSIAAAASEARAIELQARAEQQAALARRTAFNASLLRIHGWTASDPQLAVQRLHDPELCPTELHNFAWRYLNQQAVMERQELVGHPQGSSRSFFRDNGTRLISIGEQGRILEWDLSTGQHRRLRTSVSSAEPFVMSKSGAFIVTPGPEQSTFVFRSSEDIPPTRFVPRSRPAWSALLLEEEQLLALGTSSGQVEIWNHLDLEFLYVLTVGTGQVRQVSYNDVGNLVAMTSDGDVAEWSATDWTIADCEEVARSKYDFSASSISSMTIDRQGPIVALKNGQIDLFHKLAAPVRSFQTRGGIVHACLDQSGRFVVVAHKRRVDVYDRSSARFVRTLRHSDSDVVSVSVGGPIGRQLVAITCTAGPISVYRLRLEPALRVETDAVELVEVEFSPDGRWLLTLDGDGTLRIHSTDSLQSVRTLPVGSRALNCAWSPDSRSFAVTTMDGHGWFQSGLPESSGDPLTPGTYHNEGRGFTDVDFSPDGRLLAVAARGKVVLLIDAATSNVLRELPVAQRGAGTLQFSPDSRLLATGDTAGTLTLWDIATGQPVGSISAAHTNTVRALQFSPDGQAVFSVGGDAVIRRWTVPGLTLQYQAPGVREVVNDLVVSPDGSTLAIATRDGLATVFDAVTGDVQLELQVSESPVTSLSFSLDGNTLATGSRGEPALQLWLAPPVSLESRPLESRLQAVQ